MRLLLDTHIAIWVLTDDVRLSQAARELLREPSRNVFYSVVSLWEIGIKHSLGRLDMTPVAVGGGMRDSGFQRLHIADEHLKRLVTLPFHHRDPFDRMLVAQAEAEPLKLVTSDQRLLVYGSTVLLV
ncbi:type II toxin-antitoxin system VapC family toxin [Fimbriimonas ginsengisoli]|uniref:PIN domain protein n=1 Tax=Fimbriimonas ginsengisoli Gsoil 348 TaxID=661478 RepID=A0A068NZ69_FIMGI|nr:type II toxin-antitoxin system VapC family toxin [Fimbriimonas ginsengisoli]AIE88054.1 PIN domain protein [Fimbriimonas ginsengisoli Gsoil 348]